MAKMSSIERGVFWIGSISGIIISLFTVWDRITVASPPDLSLVFACNEATNVYFRPPYDSRATWTDPLPLSLLIRNNGGKSAEDVSIQFTYFVNVRILSDSTSTYRKLTLRSNEAKEMHTIQILEVHPGASIPLNTQFLIFCDKYFKQVVSSDFNTVANVDELNAISIPIDVKISAKDYKTKDITLRLTIGSEKVLRRFSNEIFFLASNSANPNERSILLTK